MNSYDVYTHTYTLMYTYTGGAQQDEQRNVVSGKVWPPPPLVILHPVEFDGILWRGRVGESARAKGGGGRGETGRD